MNLWWLRAHYPGTEGKCEYPGYHNILSPGLPRYPFFQQPKRELAGLGYEAIARAGIRTQAHGFKAKRANLITSPQRKEGHRRMMVIILGKKIEDMK